MRGELEEQEYRTGWTKRKRRGEERREREKEREEDEERIKRTMV